MDGSVVDYVNNYLIDSVSSLTRGMTSRMHGTGLDQMTCMVLTTEAAARGFPSLLWLEQIANKLHCYYIQPHALVLGYS